MIVCTVHHVSSVNELIPRACCCQLHLCITKKQLPSINTQMYSTRDPHEVRVKESKSKTYLVSMPTGVKSILCLVWNRRVLVRISMTEGGCTGVATANKARWGAAAFPSSFALNRRYFRRPLKLRAWRQRQSDTKSPQCHELFLCDSVFATRNPDALSRRQRRRQQKLLSRKQEFSGGMCWGNRLWDTSAEKPYYIKTNTFHHRLFL